MAQAYKLCPICDTPNHRNATVCTTCGATLVRVKVISTDGEAGAASSYSYHYGETDLAEGNLRWKGSTYLMGGLLVVAALICVGGLAFAGLRLFNSVNSPAAGATPIPTNSNSLAVMTNTPRPTLFLPTVTPAPPTPTRTATPTLTPTQGPCVQKVQPNDDLYSIIARCGHRDFNIMLSVVAEINELEDPSRIQIGQEIVVPWPTATLDPNATTAPESTEAASAGEAVAMVDGEPARAGGIVPTPTETLLPGIMWHEVQPDENILSIAYQYAANLKVLSELNPEVTFSQCDFGSGSGGPNCIVQLYIGQRIRVPAPTPTPTLSPTPSGSETPTPSATPTFNAPSPLSPSDRAFFRSEELITLRWVTSGSLSPDQSYRIRIEDRTGGAVYTATTRELYFIVPEEWHSQDAARHDYVWTVSVVDNDNLEQPYFTTEPRLFTWQGRGESNP
ncbi:MAG: LysM peptidoglycan-binding domain-containing protein [Chloroflexi bacterium]|nr:LysM peptidoglycan-binding domain-containing protein [Chloroflexota bacterium]